MRRAGLIALAVVGLELGSGAARAEPAPVPAAGLPLPDFSAPASAPAAEREVRELAKEATREAPKETSKEPGKPEARPPYLAMRELEQMQDRIAAGDTLAAAAHAKAIGRAAALFAAAKPAAWGDARNARALVLYLFCGGNSGAIARAVPRAALPKAFADLYEGALAYGLGDDVRAREMLSAMNPKALPAALGGHLALVQAGLATDAARAIERLDLARLLAPGTLVEEAALRKEMGLIDARTGDLAKFSLLARRYAATFPRSVYRANFKQLVRQAALFAAGAEEPAAGARLAVIVEALGARERRHLLLAISRDALLAGRMAMAATAAGQALGAEDAASGTAGGRRGETAPDVERDRARARVYLGAATIAGAGHEGARSALLAAAGAGLGGGDEALRLAALSVADTIEDPAYAAPASRGQVEAEAIRDGERALSEAEAAMKASER